MDSAAHALHLYPTALARDAALDALPAAAWTDRHLTFPEFAIELERLLPPLPGKPGVRGANELAGAACYGLLLQALHDASFKAERERFGSDAALRAAAALLAGWKGAALTPQDVSAAAVRLPRGCEARETLQFLARLYAASERLLASSGWTDREGREQGLLARLDRAAALPAQLLPRGAPLEAHGFHRLVLFQRRVLERVAALGHPVRLHLPCAPAHDPSEGLLRTFGPLRPSHAVPAIAPPREQLRIEAATPYDEVYEIGRRIRRWITDDNVPPAAIALAFRDLGAYSQFVSDVFKRFGIPFYERRGEPAAFQPVVRVALSAVAACANGLPRADLFRFLCSGVVHVAALAGRPGEEVDAGALHKLALDARIDRFFGDEARQPAKAWAARLERYARTSKDTDARAVAVLCAAVERLDGMRDERSARDHALAWKTLFGEAGLSRAALLRGEGPGPDQHKDRLAVAELEQALDAIAASPFAAGARITLEEFQRLLSLEIAEHFVRAEGSARGGVRVLNLYDLRGLHFQKLIIGGMAEGSFPAAQTPDPLLGGGCEHDLRGALARGRETDLLYVEPRLKDECGEEERALFDIACAAAAGATLVFTRPCVSVEGRPVEPSVFWDTDAKAQPEKAAAISPAPPLSQCITAEEVELRAAWVLGGGAARGGPLTSDSLRSSRPSPHGGEEDEGPAAAACFARTPRLRNLAHLAAIERHRQRFFAWQGSAKEIGGHDSPTAGERIAAGPYDGMVALTAPEAAAAVAEMVLVQASSREIGGHDSQISPS
ncbi:MAG: hypothetical protein NTW87_30965, partial [Planctomycetota bacterium]|nr:hypothetical protein [Planctomycetota bacterium]